MAEVTNYIDRLVAELCPDGVEYRPLGSLGKRNKGTAITASKMRSLEPGNKDLRIFAAGSTFVDTDSSNIPAKDILHGPAIIVKSRGYIGFEYYEKSFTHKNEMWSYTLDSSIVDQKFIYYYLLTQAYYLQELARSKSVKLPQLAVKDTDSLEVPVPPMEVQEAIVEILDKFTNLEAELEAELEARTLQYEYYRDSLFEALDCPRVPLGSFARLVRGSGMPKTDFSESGVGAIHYGQIYTKFGTATAEVIAHVPEEKAKKLAVVNPGDVIVANTSENLEDVCKAVAWVGESDIVTGGHATVIKAPEQNAKFISYYMATGRFNKDKRRHAFGTKVIDVAPKNLAKIEFPLPPLEEQQRIVDILDRFDALTSSLSEGLPAELAARRSQYEYYRDQLLTFPRKGENQ